MAKQQETCFKEKVLPLLRSLPRTWVYKTQEVARRGIPDIICCIHGCFVALELKTLDGEASKLQQYNLRRIGKAGGISVLVTPSNWELTFQFLLQIAESGYDSLEANHDDITYVDDEGAS